MKLRFRAVTEADLAMILHWRTMPEVSAYMYTDFEPDMDQQRAWFETICNDDTRLDWVIHLDGEDVGFLSIVRIDRHNRRCEWAYYLASPSVRGKGIGKAVELNVLRYVFETLDLNKLCCEVYLSNELVIKIHEKYGSKVEGTRRQQIWKGGQFHDIVEMGILREEWERTIKGQVAFVEADIEEIGKQVVRG